MQSVDLSNLMGCSLPLQVDRVSYSAQPTVERDVGRTGTEVLVEGEGFVHVATDAALPAALAAIGTATAVSGQDFTVTGVGGGVVHRVSAAACLEGGPHVGFVVLEAGSGPAFRRVRFRVQARVVGPADVSAYRYRLQAGPDALQRVEQAGSVSGPTAGATYLGIAGGFAAGHPADRYLVESDVQYPYSSAGPTAALEVRYVLRAQQLADPLPGGGTAAGVVDGQATVRDQRDEQQRLVRTYEFDLNLSGGDYQAVADQLRSAITDPIVRESVAYVSVRRRQLRCSFEVLLSADQDGLLNFQQTLTVVGADDAYEEFAYPGADPVAIARPKAFPRVTQAGSAVGLGKFPQPPDPLLDDFEQRPVRRFTDVSAREKAAEWQYEFIAVSTGDDGPDVASLVAGLGRSSIGGFYEVDG